MRIDAELAQRIVDIIIPVVHRNVNLMDPRGIIIASGHPHRIGTVHTGARLAVETGETVEIFPDELARYPGALQGINIPIFRDGAPIGVVGIFGEPSEVHNTAQLVKMIAELELERAALQRESGADRRLREEFAALLLHHPGDELPPAARRLARPFGFDLERPRVVALFHAASESGALRGELGNLTRLPLETLQAPPGHTEELRPGDFVAPRGESVVVLFEAGDEAVLRPRVEALRRHLAHASDLMVRAGLGGRVPAGALPASCRQAAFALARADRRTPLRALSEPALLAAYLRARLAEGEGGVAGLPVLAEVAALCRRRPALRATLRALLASNLDGSATAAALGVHRNTLSYRLARFGEQTGLAPTRCFTDAVLCWIALQEGGTPP